MPTSHRPGRRRWLATTLFWIYSAAYAAFVLAAAFWTFHGGEPVGGLALPAFAGLSVAVVAGFGLIAGAFVLAMLYAVCGSHDEAETPGAHR